jgi:hypothetical protein
MSDNKKKRGNIINESFFSIFCHPSTMFDVYSILIPYSKYVIVNIRNSFLFPSLLLRLFFSAIMRIGIINTNRAVSFDANCQLIGITNANIISSKYSMACSVVSLLK